jgi:cell division protein FtsW (lipid II flippase)
LRPQVRKRKQATDHRKAEIKEMLITVVIVGLVLAAGIAGLALLAYHSMGIAAMNEFIPDKKAYQSNRRRMAWAALGMMIVCTGAVIIDPARMAQADAILMMMYGSLSALVGAYFGFANMGAQQPTERRRHEEDRRAG